MEAEALVHTLVETLPQEDTNKVSDIISNVEGEDKGTDPSAAWYAIKR